MTPNFPLFQSHFPTVDDAKLKEMDTKIAAMTQKLRGCEERQKRLETGKLHVHIVIVRSSVVTDRRLTERNETLRSNTGNHP